MAIEVERKFLVKGDYKNLVTKKSDIVQGFLSTVPERTVRIRIVEARGFLTVKGIGNVSGTTRYEFETEIDIVDAKDMLKLCEPGIIEKTRHIVPCKSDLVFEIDEFYGENRGLTIAEIELPSETFSFEKPEWLGKEVTGDVRYFNAMLMKNPFKNW